MHAILRLAVGISGLLYIVGSLGCQTPTSFEGEAKFPGGPRGCYQRCQAEQLEMASFVYVGEYSSACACQLRRTGPAASNETVSSAVVAAAAGSELQRRRIAAQQAAASHPVYVAH